ncbi:hypothetical protein Q3G72_004641 [Acer saccharum]|nr:hypothetical protein Q3G72_004641 [Acer saccharum]
MMTGVGVEDEDAATAEDEDEDVVVVLRAHTSLEPNEILQDPWFREDDTSCGSVRWLTSGDDNDECDHQRATIGGEGGWLRPALRDRGGVVTRGEVFTYGGVASQPIVVAPSTSLVEKTSHSWISFAIKRTNRRLHYGGLVIGDWRIFLDRP